MKLRNVLIVVSDMERSIKFYHELFGLHVLLNQGGNVIMTEGLVLQDKTIWEKFVGREVISENNATELYFEENDIEGFVEKLENYDMPIKYVNGLLSADRSGSGEKKVVRFYDPDGNLIEVGTPV